MKKIIAVRVIAVLISITVVTSAQRFGDPIHGSRLPISLYRPQQSHYAMYMKVEGMKGESTDENHKEWIDILSYEFGGEEEIVESSALPTGGRVLHPLIIKKEMDIASPELHETCGNSSSIDSFFDVFVEIDCEHGTFMQYNFTNARISSYSVSGVPASGMEKPIETITIIYEGVKTVYTQYDHRGRIIAIEESEWADSIVT